MVRSVLVGALLVAIGAAAASVVMSWRSPTAPARDDQPAASSRPAPGREFGAFGARADGDHSQVDIERRLRRLEDRLTADAAERERLEERFEAVVAQLAALGGPAEATAPEVGAGAGATAAAAPAGDANANPIDDSMSAMERALAAAGIDAATATDIKRRRDELAMTEIYLRDRATREQWLDSPRFTEEMAAIESQRTPIRDEVGDDAYDRYLYALGQSNRVRIDEVLSQSPAAQAGLQAGDMIVRYGATRIFAPGELVAETRGGTAGEAVRLEVIRNGERLEVEVPRGPLGLQIAATQAAPEAS